MDSFNVTEFAQQVLAEALFYDDEYGAIGNVSLIDPNLRKECFIASFVPGEGAFVIERALDWEDYDVDTDDDEIGYVLAIDSVEFGEYDNPSETAVALLALAQQNDYVPSITLLFEEEDLV